MEKYQKGENLDFIHDIIKQVLEELSLVFPNEISTSTKPMHVKAGSKLRNLIPVATNQCTREDQGFSVIVGSGNGVTKAVIVGPII